MNMVFRNVWVAVIFVINSSGTGIENSLLNNDYLMMIPKQDTSYSIDFAHKKRPLAIIFAHGFGDDKGQAKPYYNRSYFVADWVYSFDFIDAKYSALYRSYSFIAKAFFSSARRYSAIGQKSDIDHLVKAIEDVVQIHPGAAILLYGVSRGAVTVINSLGTLAQQDDKRYLLSSVVGAILESPFASSHDVIDAFLPAIPLGIKCMLFSWLYPNHQLTGEQPIKLVPFMPLDIPLLMVASVRDTIVPYSSTLRLYDFIVSQRHGKPEVAPVVWCSLSEGEHGRLFSPAYKDSVMSFMRYLMETL